jgi:transposase-like protein
MSKNARKSDHLQLVDEASTATVQIPLPILDAYSSIERSFFDLCVNAGQQVLSAMMEHDREDLCGPRWHRDSDRKAGRGGTTRSEITLGGRRVPITRPRARSVDGAELELPSFAFAASRDALDRHTIDAVACGVSNRKYARSLEDLPDGIEERSVSKSSVSRRYVALTTRQMTTWLTKPISDRHFPVIMIDGIILGDHTVLIALGIDFEGKKEVLGLREGNTESGRVA